MQTQSVDDIISAIQDATKRNIKFSAYAMPTGKTLFSTMNAIKILTIEESSKVVDSLIHIGRDVILAGLNIDAKGNNCWCFFDIAFTNLNIPFEMHLKSFVAYEERKIYKNWAQLALECYEEILPSITDTELLMHDVALLPFTRAPTNNFKKLHAKDILIFFTLIRKKYKDIVLNVHMCFRFDDIDISMKCVNTIQKYRPPAYDFISNNIIKLP